MHSGALVTSACAVASCTVATASKMVFPGTAQCWQTLNYLNTDGITTDNQQLIAETFNNYVTSIAENIKTTDRNAYIQYKNTPDTAIIAISAQYVRKWEN